jgi:hypothetical protein
MNLAMVPVRLRIWHMVRIKTSLRFHSEPSLAGESVLTLISKVGSLFSIPIRFSDRLYGHGSEDDLGDRISTVGHRGVLPRSQGSLVCW